MKCAAGEIGDADHVVNHLLSFRRIVTLDLCQHDAGLVVVGQIVQCRHDAPAIHLSLVDLLGSVIEPAGIAQPDGIGRGKQAKRRVRFDHPVLVKQRQLARNFEHPLNDEHHVGTSGIVLVKHQRSVGLQGPRQDAFLEFRNLVTVLDHESRPCRPDRYG